MFASTNSWVPDPSPDGLLTVLAAVVDDLADVDPTRCSVDDRAALLAGVWHQSDRLHALLARLARAADLAGDWTAVGAPSCRAWLAVLADTSVHQARHHVEVGAALEHLRAVARAAIDGSLSWAATEVLATTVTPRTKKLAERDDEMLLQQALQLRYVTSSTPCATGANEPTPTRPAAHPPDPMERRSFRLTTAADGYGLGRLTLDPEAHALVTRALDHLAGAPTNHDRRPTARRRADALVELSAAFLAGGIVGGRGPAHLDVLVPADTVTGTGDDPGVTSDGITVDADVVRRWACDSLIGRIILDADGLPLDVGRAHRLATPAIWRALIARDGGCTNPWCDRPPEWCEAHHLTGNWHDPATSTSVDQMALTCRRCHPLIHGGGWTIRIINGHPIWHDPHGHPVPPPAHRRRRPPHLPTDDPP